jgi:hypothetical protein
MRVLEFSSDACYNGAPQAAAPLDLQVMSLRCEPASEALHTSVK